MIYRYSVIMLAAGCFVYYCPDLNVAGESDANNYIPDAECAITKTVQDDFIQKGIALPQASSTNEVAEKMDAFLAEKYAIGAYTKRCLECFVHVPATPEAL